MSFPSLPRPVARRLAAGAALCALAGACLAAPLPPVQTQHGVPYLSGGIGLDESHAIEHAAAGWPLVLEFAERDGRQADFVADVHVRIRDHEGRSVLSTTAEGPFLLARLAPGRYRVEARFGDRAIEQAVDVPAHGSARRVFTWSRAHVGAAG